MKRYFVRFLSLLSGSLLYAIGVVLTIRANVGYSPWEVFHVGLSLTTGISLGIITIIVGTVIVIFVTVVGEKLGFGSILSVLFTGFGIDLLFFLNVIPIAPNYATGMVMMIAGLFVISFGTFFYIRSAFSAGPRDNLMIIIKRKTKFPIGVCRVIVEFLVTGAGWLLGGMVGIGTIVSVVAIGFCIQITFTLLRFKPTEVDHETLIQTCRGIRNCFRKL